MAVERIDSALLTMDAVEALGLDTATTKLISPEGLAASIRRAASFHCPTAPAALVRTVTEALIGLPGFTDECRPQVEDLVRALVSYGDLLELPSEDAGRRQLFLGPPAFVRGTNSCFILGVRPECAPLVGGELLERIKLKGHVRLIRSAESEPLNEVLRGEGLVELRQEQWLKAPRQASANELVTYYVDRLEAAGQAGNVEGAQVIDPASKVTYYRGRWRPLKKGDWGRFVARRPQAFGADLWCFAEVQHGEVTKLVDLPLQSPLAPGADEAWRLQAAIDALAGHPQRVRLRSAPGSDSVVLDFFSPLPSWGQRHLDIVGTPLPKSRGALFSYEFPVKEAGDELGFLEERMWLYVQNGTEGMNGDR